MDIFKELPDLDAMVKVAAVKRQPLSKSDLANIQHVKNNPTLSLGKLYKKPSESPIQKEIEKYMRAEQVELAKKRFEEARAPSDMDAHDYFNDETSPTMEILIKKTAYSKLPVNLKNKIDIGETIIEDTNIQWAFHDSQSLVACPRCGTPSPIDFSMCPQCGENFED